MDDFEAHRWEEEGWQRERDAYVARLKGQQAKLTKQRLATFEWIKSLLPDVSKAYLALGIEARQGETVGGLRLAEQLSRQGVVTQRGVDPVELADKGKAWANALRDEADATLIDEAVMECRTLLTARCLSANFSANELGPLETEYIEIIADILAVGRELRNQTILSRGQLLERAREDAIETARRQRKDKPPVTMAARERYWRDRPSPVRRVFE